MKVHELKKYLCHYHVKKSENERQGRWMTGNSRGDNRLCITIEEGMKPLPEGHSKLNRQDKKD